MQCAFGVLRALSAARLPQPCAVPLANQRVEVPQMMMGSQALAVRQNPFLLHSASFRCSSTFDFGPILVLMELACSLFGHFWDALGGHDTRVCEGSKPCDH